ncbi:hypothetical protein TKK_0018678 [Trichogramma kaykai]|uniref:Uncharacterized protein n=1 Tax=Trichogramma kaykai TaxID=54128 RepID=A0ABD2VX92_9HYME
MRRVGFHRDARLVYAIRSSQFEDMAFFSRIGRAYRDFDHMSHRRKDIPDTELHQLASNSEATKDNFVNLVNAGANLDAENGRGFTPMMEAIYHKNDLILSCLIEAGADVNYANSRGLTPVLVACNLGNVPAVSLLLRNGGAADARTRECKLGALHFLTASKFRNPDEVSSRDIRWMSLRLAEARANVNARDSKGETPLHYAMKTNDVSIFVHYIELGASTGFVTDDCNTMLHELMVDRGQLTDDQKQMAEILLSRDADINAVNDKGEVPLHCAIISGRQQKVQFLLERGADPSRWWSNRLGSALTRYNDWSVGCDRPQMCAATHHPDQLTLLNSAIKLGKVEVVKYLIRYLGTGEVERPNRTDNHDAVKTPLFYALPSSEMVKILLDAGANFRRGVLHMSSLVHLAVRHDFSDSLALLLDHGADHDAMDFEGHTPLECSLRLSRESTKRTKLLVQQHLRMRTMTLDSLDRVARAENAPWLAKFSRECQKELERMRTDYFSEDISCSVFRTFAFRDIDSLDVDTTWRDIGWVFYEHERRKRYPIYADMLATRFERIRERQIALDKGIYVLNVYLEPVAEWLCLGTRLPGPVLHAIIRNFSNADIAWSYEHLKPL